MGVYGRDLGHVANDVAAVVNRFGQIDRKDPNHPLVPYDPTSTGPQKKLLRGSAIVLSGEYARMQNTFRSLGVGLVLATLLIYFLMVALFKSWLTPLVVLSAVPVGLIGVITVLFLTGTAINVQSLLGVIFMVGIVVSNTVLLTDFAQNLRTSEGLNPTQAIVKAASIRVRPVVMTALAAFFALIPMALALARGSEANAPLGRAVIGGLLAGLVTTLFVVPSLYSLVVRDPQAPAAEEGPGAPEAEPPSGNVEGPDIRITPG
jgi:multidrug efflux pump subunit AcrB